MQYNLVSIRLAVFCGWLGLVKNVAVGVGTGEQGRQLFTQFSDQMSRVCILLTNITSKIIFILKDKFV